MQPIAGLNGVDAAVGAVRLNKRKIDGPQINDRERPPIWGENAGYNCGVC